MYFSHNSHLDCFLFPYHTLRQPQDQLIEQTHIPAGWRPPTSHSKKCQFPSVNEQARSKITKPNPTKRADVVLSCLLPRPALKCMLERASKQAAAWPPGDCPPCCPLRAGSPSQNSPFSLPAPAAAVHARQTLAFTTQPLPLPSYLASLT